MVGRWVPWCKIVLGHLFRDWWLFHRSPVLLLRWLGSGRLYFPDSRRSVDRFLLNGTHITKTWYVCFRLMVPWTSVCFRHRLSYSKRLSCRKCEIVSLGKTVRVYVARNPDQNVYLNLGQKQEGGVTSAIWHVETTLCSTNKAQAA